MGYRILVDENLDPQTATLLIDRGFEADHVGETVGKGAGDAEIRTYCPQHDYLLLTNDTDFLRPEVRQELQVVYVPGNAPRAYNMAPRIEKLASIIPDQDDLPPLTWLTHERFSK